MLGSVRQLTPLLTAADPYLPALESQHVLADCRQQPEARFRCLCRACLHQPLHCDFNRQICDGP